MELPRRTFFDPLYHAPHAPFARLPKIDEWAEIEERARAEAFSALPWRGRVGYRRRPALCLKVTISFVPALFGNRDRCRGNGAVFIECLVERS